MKASLWLVAGWFLCCVVGFASWCAAAGADEGSSQASSFSLSSSPLVISGSFETGRQLEAAHEAVRDSPEAVALRSASRTEFESLDSEQAGKVAGEAFAAALDEPAGGLPQLSAGQSIVAYPRDDVARLDLGEGRRGVVESLVPVAVGGQPIDLSLSEAGGGFEPRLPAVGVRIAKRLSQGAALASMGLAVAPVDAQGTPLSGAEGVLDGASVFFANTQTDTDTVMKPATLGLEVETMLRSVDSPQELHLRIGLPDGASLVAATGTGAGGAEVLKGGEVIAAISAPRAVAADGSPVPTSSLSVSGSTLSFEVEHQSGEYQYPILVDPSVVDSKLITGGGEISNWREEPAPPSKYKFSEASEHGGTIEDRVEPGPHSTGEFGGIAYQTQGISRIFAISALLYGSVSPFGYESQYESRLFIKHTEGAETQIEGEEAVPGYLERVRKEVCARVCSATGGRPGNYAGYEQIFTNNGTNGFWTLFSEPDVEIEQESGPEVNLDSEDLAIKEQPNASYNNGSAGWFSPAVSDPVIGVTAKDPGLGIFSATVTSPQELAGLNPYKTASKPLAGCHGIQCIQCWEWHATCESGAPRSSYEPLTFNIAPLSENKFVSWLPNGEDSVTVTVEDAPGFKSSKTETVRIDGTPPTGLSITGLPSSKEIGEGLYTLKAEATDGSGSTPSSGVRSLALAVDGRQVGQPAGFCSPGPCSASAEWKINGSEFGAGVHALTVTATDNAGNVASETVAIKIHHTSPVGIGPGSVDPQSGAFSVAASDVMIGSPGASLSVARSYNSRRPAAGAESPLGSQWALALGGLSESLSALPNGSMVLAGAAGEVSTFTRNENGEYEAPKGDASLILEAKEREAGKGVSEYLLKDPAQGSVTKFAQPSGFQSTSPSYSGQFGSSAAEGGALNTPGGIALDSEGDLWVDNQLGDQVDKYSASGHFLASYNPDSLQEPESLAVSPTTGNIYVSNTGRDRVDEMSPSGTLITSFGEAGSGTGQLGSPNGLRVDASGNVWVADRVNNKVLEYSSSGGYLMTVGGKAGSGNGEFKEPNDVALCDGMLYVVDQGNDRVQYFSMTGKYEGQFGGEGKENGKFIVPSRIACEPAKNDVYVSDKGNDRVEEFTASGLFLDAFGSEGQGEGQFATPVGVAVGPQDTVYVGDRNNNRIELWNHPTWIPAAAEGPAASNVPTYSYRAVEVEGKRTLIEPTEELAPKAAHVECPVEKPKAGCRLLTFKYAEKTTATETSWGEYSGRLMEVIFTAGEASPVAVAKYAYDEKGLLRAEWDPRVSPNLKTIYGYDGEGHLTSIAGPGQEPWLMHYGAIAGEPNPGRLLSVSRPSASTVLGSRAPVSTGAPTLSNTSPVIGTTLNVTTSGTWSNGPLAYDYQWEDCNSSGAACVPIIGATNKSYTPQATDAGYTLVGQVTVQNAYGDAVASTAASKALAMPADSHSKDFGTLGSEEGKLNQPYGVAVDAGGNVWVADRENNRIEQFSSAGVFQHAYTGDSMLNPVAVAVSPTSGNLYVTNQGRDRIDEFSPSGSLLAAFGGEGSGPGRLNLPNGLAVDQNGDVWVADIHNNRVEEFTPSGGFIRTVGSAGTGNGQFGEPHDVTECAGMLYVTDQNNHRVEMFSLEGGYIGQFGSEGTGNGQFTLANRIACEPVGRDVYVSDKTADRVQEFNAAGTYLATFGSGGEGESQFSSSTGMAVGASGVVYVVDTGHNRIQKWTSSYSTNNPVPTPPSLGSNAVWTADYKIPVSGTHLPTLTEEEVEKWGQKDYPTEGVAVFPPDEPQGWPASEYKRATIDYLDVGGRTVDVSTPLGGIATSEYNTMNEVVRTLSPDDRAAALKEGCVSVSKKECKSAEVAELLDTKTEYNAEGNEELKVTGPQHVIQLASSKEEVKARDVKRYYYDEGAPATGETYRLVTKLTDGALLGGGEEKDARTTTTGYSGQSNLGWKLRKPTSVTTDPEGLKLTHTTLYDAGTGAVIETKMPASRQPTEYSLPSGSKPSGIATGADKNLWVTEAGTSKVAKLTTAGAVTEYVTEKDTPEGIAPGPDGNLWFVGNTVRHINHMTTTGALTVYTLTRTNTANVSIAAGPDGNLWFTESQGNEIGKINTKDELLAEYAPPAGSKPYGITAGPDGNLWFTDYATSKIAKITTSGEITEYGLPTGSEPYGITAGSDGNLWFTDYGTGKVGKITTSGTVTEYGLPSGSGPRGITSGPEGNLWVAEYASSRIAMLTTSGTISEYALPFGSQPQGITEGSDKNIWFTEEGTSKIASIKPPSMNGNEGAHDRQIINYTSGTEASVAACQNHPEWAGLPCETRPAAQPEDGLPELPVAVTTYNIWDEPETTTETVGSTTRKKTETYDAAGRLKTTSETSTVGTALPAVTSEYSPETGALEKQSTTSESKTETITGQYNRLGLLESYTDAAGNLSSYEYDIDGRVTKVNDGKGTQTYTYDSRTGLPTELVDSSHEGMKFTATYDVEGNMLSESYPNGMSASYTYNQTGTPTGLEYKKLTHCTEKCTWFYDTVVPSIHNQWLEQTSSLSHQAYTYDASGRLTQTQDTPAGKGCLTRIYAYDEDTNRTSLSTAEPNAKGECATEGATTENHGYDSADRLTDSGTSYDTFGDVTKLPAADAGGAALVSSYYVDDQLQSQAQNEQTIGYTLDPAGRTLETVSTGKPIVSDVTSHYAGPEADPAWTMNTATEWTRNIRGLSGRLAAVQNNGEAPVLQLANLHGDIVATAYLSETATGLASSADTTEFGVPTTNLPPKYSWLGAGEIPTELPSGTVAMGARSYVPQLGRFLQPDPIPGGSANAYTYTFGDPIDSYDPSGMLTYGFSAEELAGFSQASQEVVEREAAREAAERAAAEAAARAAAEAAMSAAGPQYEEEEWWWWEEEGGYEYASYHPEVQNGNDEERHVEAAVLYQPLGETSKVLSFGGGWSRIFAEYGSRCEQYGGHWVGHSCVGTFPSHHHGSGHHGGGAVERCAKGAVAGGVGGAAGGAAGGAMVGGAGAWPGAVAGGVAGAIGGCITGVLGG